MCDMWEKWVVWVEKSKTPRKESNCEIWGKGVCDKWEKWVVWVEKSKTLLRKSISTSFQERATKLSHSNVGKLAYRHGDAKLARVCAAIAGDEARHERAYTAFVSSMFDADPSGAMVAYAEMMRSQVFRLPTPFLPYVAPHFFPYVTFYSRFSTYLFFAHPHPFRPYVAPHFSHISPFNDALADRNARRAHGRLLQPEPLCRLLECGLKARSVHRVRLHGHTRAPQPRVGGRDERGA